MPAKKQNIHERFWAKVQLGRGCWLWVAAKLTGGYGAFQVDGRVRRAHRVSWELFLEPIPEGMDVLHTCDRPSCIRPIHLFLGTDVDNAQDRVQKKRHAFGERHGRSKLSSVNVGAIRQEYGSSGGDYVGYYKLAKKYGVSKTTIAKVVRGERWTHLPMEGAR